MQLDPIPELATPHREPRRTKILATLGPSTDRPGVLEQMVDAGLDAVRINCAYDTPEKWAERVTRVRGAARVAGKALSVLADLSGPKLRLPEDTATRDVAVGEELLFTGDRAREGAVTSGWAGLPEAVDPARSEIVIGDGTPRLRVTGVEDGAVRAVCTRGGRMAARKGFYVTFATGGAGTLDADDLRDLDAVTAIGVDFVALSFVRTAADVRRLRDELNRRGSKARMIAKIEKVEAVGGLDEILEVADGVMVARGDLGVEVGVARVPTLQKEVIHRATTQGKLVITATQMLESMITNPEPTRAEATDVANAVLDGTSAVMLSGETTVGRHPIDAVKAMAEIAEVAEAADRPFHLDIGAEPQTVPEAVIQSAVHMAEQLDAAAILIPTTTGGSARAAAKYRPSRPVLALCQDTLVYNQLGLEWGVVPGMLPDGLETPDQLINGTLAGGRKQLGLTDDDLVVLTYGQRVSKPGSTNLILVRRLADGGT